MEIAENLENAKTKEPMQVLEDALDATGFGRFNLRLLLALFTGSASLVFISSSISYILPAAECDLNMSLTEKGWLMTAFNFGQLSSAVLVGFLSDTFGRRPLILIGSMGMVITRLLEGSSQTYIMMWLVGIFEGVIATLAFVALPTMVSEFTPVKYRDLCLLVYVSYSPVANILLPLLAWAVLPNDWHFVLVEGYFELKSWNILIYCCSLWSLLTAVQFYFIPESPKFLFMQGKHEEALTAIKVAYCENTGKLAHTFPIKRLPSFSSIREKPMGLRDKIKGTLKDMKVLLQRTLLLRIILFSFYGILLSNNLSSFNNWYPQLSTIIENYKAETGDTAMFCKMIDYHKNKTFYTEGVLEDVGLFNDEGCVPITSGKDTYLSGTLMGAACFAVIIVNALLVRRFGPRHLMFLCASVCCCSSIGLYWTHTLGQTAFVMILIVACLLGTQSLYINIKMRSFPTGVRSVAMSTSLIFLRVGTILGNTLFPILLEYNCAYPLVILSASTGVMAGVAFLFPNISPNNKKTDG